MYSVSVIMPVYNSASFIEQTIENISRQSFRDFELLAINDGSADATREILDRLAATHAFLKPIHLDQNGGAYLARNVGLGKAKGEYVAFIDADDLLSDDRFEKLFRAAKSHDLDFICDNLIIFDHEAQQPVGTLFNTRKDMIALDFETFCALDRPTNHFNIGLIKPMIRRTFLDRHDLRFNVDFRSNADFAFFTLVLSQRPKAGLLRESLYRYTAPVGPLSNRHSPDRRTSAKLSNFIALDEWTISRIREKSPELNIVPLLRHKSSLERHQVILDLIGRKSFISLANAGVRIVASPRHIIFSTERLLGKRFRQLTLP